jgi:hypothetical protein
MKYLILLSIVLLAGCAKSPSQAEMHPSKTEMHLSREEIKALCKSVGDKAFAEANNGTKSFSAIRLTAPCGGQTANIRCSNWKGPNHIRGW